MTAQVLAEKLKELFGSVHAGGSVELSIGKINASMPLFIGCLKHLDDINLMALQHEMFLEAAYRMGQKQNEMAILRATAGQRE